MLPIKSPEQPENPTSLTIAVIGAPNAGKSTLVNRIVGAKVRLNIKIYILCDYMR